jgi:hypothetical protein
VLIYSAILVIIFLSLKNMRQGPNDIYYYRSHRRDNI